ncbi:MAG TPA: sigma-70 family RNA polymerase sigma factor [Cyclobacteriaceae bacterium]|nr:sigma-70 family RNA polymerase sigma factor [Cyclobacteriaceae bacterium]
MKNYEKLGDQDLITLILEKDSLATGELYKRYYKKVYQKCLSLVRDPDEAFDLAEESLMRAFEKLDTFKGDSSFSTWLYVITHRHCLGFLRKASHGRPSIDGASQKEEYEEVNLNEVDSVDPHAIMLTLINEMPQKEKALLLLKYYEGESIESLQHHLNLSASAIKMRLKRSKEKLNYLYSIAVSSGLASALALL